VPDGDTERSLMAACGAPAYRAVPAAASATEKHAPIVPTSSGAQSAVVSNAYEIAKAGGAHAGLLRRYAGESDRQVEKSLRSVERRLADHLAKIENPSTGVEPGTSASDIAYLVNSYWPKEVLNFRAEADVLRGILQERENGK